MRMDTRSDRSNPTRRNRRNQRLLIVAAGLTLCAVLIGIIGVFSASRLTRPSGSARAKATPDATATSGTPWVFNPTTDNSTAAILAAEREADIQATAQADLNGMTLDEKLGQMFLIETYYQTWTPDIANMVVQMHAGAVIIYAKNMKTPQQLKAYIASIQAHAKIPLLVTMDEEGGLVDRLGYNHFFPPLPAAQTLGAIGKPALATQAGDQAAQEMLEMGINTDLAPVVDVRGPNGSIETTRLYGNNPATVTTFAGAYLDALQSHGVIGTLKHWPGIGNVTLDPHLTLPTINDSMAQLQAQHFATFRALLSHNPGMIMVTHVIVNAIDPKMPATLSPKLVNGVLRGQLGYDGVVMTDSLYMQGIAIHYNLPEAGVLSVIAGDDLLEGAFDTTSMAGMIAALKAAIASGRITVARINQSVMRILKLKIRFGLLPLRTTHYRRFQQSNGIGQTPAGSLQADTRRNGVTGQSTFSTYS
jgi:beta-N-acetylhexosaminidase